jgi:uncharacterized membrane protein YeaQ/YmgE (transglycosylase-associated protein family)
MGIGHDPLQMTRMLFFWPMVVASFAWWLAFLVVERVQPRRHGNVFLALVVAACAGLVAANISRSWDDGQFYWLAFSVGLLGAAVVMWIGIAWVAMERVRTR